MDLIAIANVCQMMGVTSCPGTHNVLAAILSVLYPFNIYPRKANTLEPAGDGNVYVTILDLLFEAQEEDKLTRVGLVALAAPGVMSPPRVLVDFQEVGRYFYGNPAILASYKSASAVFPADNPGGASADKNLLVTKNMFEYFLYKTAAAAEEYECLSTLLLRCLDRHILHEIPWPARNSKLAQQAISDYLAKDESPPPHKKKYTVAEENECGSGSFLEKLAESVSAISKRRAVEFDTEWCFATPQEFAQFYEKKFFGGSGSDIQWCNFFHWRPFPSASPDVNWVAVKFFTPVLASDGKTHCVAATAAACEYYNTHQLQLAQLDFADTVLPVMSACVWKKKDSLKLNLREIIADTHSELRKQQQSFAPVSLPKFRTRVESLILETLLDFWGDYPLTPLVKKFIQYHWCLANTRELDDSEIYLNGYKYGFGYEGDNLEDLNSDNTAIVIF